jgi:hypothetical protein
VARALSEQMFQIFLTHDWGEDELGRSNHDRVRRVYQRLGELGVSAWFDEVQMDGDINEKVSVGCCRAPLIPLLHTHTLCLCLPCSVPDEIRAASSQMTEGIDHSKTMGVFVTERYIAKASGRGDNGANDNCKMEVSPFLGLFGLGRVFLVRRCEVGVAATQTFTLYTLLCSDIAGLRGRSGVHFCTRFPARNVFCGNADLQAIRPASRCLQTVPCSSVRLWWVLEEPKGPKGPDEVACFPKTV